MFEVRLLIPRTDRERFLSLVDLRQYALGERYWVNRGVLFSLRDLPGHFSGVEFVFTCDNPHQKVTEIFRETNGLVTFWNVGIFRKEFGEVWGI